MAAQCLHQRFGCTRFADGYGMYPNRALYGIGIRLPETLAPMLEIGWGFEGAAAQVAADQEGGRGATTWRKGGVSCLRVLCRNRPILSETETEDIALMRVLRKGNRPSERFQTAFNTGIKAFTSLAPYIFSDGLCFAWRGFPFHRQRLALWLCSPVCRPESRRSCSSCGAAGRYRHTRLLCRA